MKAHWTYKDYFRMIHNNLNFTSDDVDLIYDGLDSRFAKAPKVIY